MRFNGVTLIPACLAVCLLGFLYFSMHPRAVEAPTLQGFSLSEFQLPSERDNIVFSSKEMLGKWALLNIWATWCSACAAEHEALMQIAQSIPIYGISYRDEKKDVQAWLKEHGNPYRKTGLDEFGRLVVELGVMGTPETYLIDPQGRVRYRHIGALTAHDWQTYFLPILKQH